jgi:hypothetical protein
MQENFLKNEQIVKALRKSISEARFARYLGESNGDQVMALRLYHWNSLLSQSLYLPLQMWEITLRNKLNYFLTWKYNQKWPYDERCIRQLARPEEKRLTEAKQRQKQRRGVDPVPTDALVADLSIGFWAALLTKSYDVPYVWRATLDRIFPHEPKIGRDNASALCDRLVDLRNRVAHHEAIYHLDLEARWKDLNRIIAAMCDGTGAYAQSACPFEEILKARPT